MVLDKARLDGQGAAGLRQVDGLLHETDAGFALLPCARDHQPQFGVLVGRQQPLLAHVTYAAGDTSFTGLYRV